MTVLTMQGQDHVQTQLGTRLAVLLVTDGQEGTT
jgi:hypothetical protein